MSDEPIFSQLPEFSGIAKAMQIEPIAWEKGSVSVGVTVTKAHTNVGGVAHGGLASMMLDMALGGRWSRPYWSRNGVQLLHSM